MLSACQIDDAANWMSCSFQLCKGIQKLPAVQYSWMASVCSVHHDRPALPVHSRQVITAAYRSTRWQENLLCDGRGLLFTAGALCSRSASAARLANSRSAPNLLPSSMSMLACTIPLQGWLSLSASL